MVAAGILGYMYEPQMRYWLTGKAPEPKKNEIRSTVLATGTSTVVIDPASYSPEQLPEKVLLKANVEIFDAASDLKMTVTAGNTVHLLRLEGSNVVISPAAGSFEGTVPISQTDLLEQLAAIPKNPARADLPAVADVNVPSEDPAPDKEAEMTPEPELEMEPEPITKPEAQPDPGAELEPASDQPVDVLAVMQESIRSGSIKEFSFDQVLDWQVSEELETIDGESYQTGIASYKAETVFGVKTIQAKALIKGSEVVRWLWPKSGMEIK